MLLMPVMGYRFRVRIQDSRWTEEETEFLYRQVMSVKTDYVRKAISLCVRQPIPGNMQELALRIAQQGLEELRVEAIHPQPNDGTEKVLYVVAARNLTPESHRSEYDYGASDHVWHSFVFTAEDFRLVDPPAVTKREHKPKVVDPVDFVSIEEVWEMFKSRTV